MFQLKSILSKHNREKKLGIKLISKRRKGDVLDVINYLLYHKYNLNDLPNIKKPPTPTRNVLKRFGTKKYNDDEQQEFSKKGYDIENPLKKVKRNTLIKNHNNMKN